MANIEQQRNELWRRVRFQHGIRLSNPTIETIESFFHESIKESIYHVGMYRIINIVFSVLFLAGWIIFHNTPVIHWFVPTVFVAFLCYNIIHVLMNYWMYKKIQPPTPVSDIPNPTTDDGSH